MTRRPTPFDAVVVGRGAVGLAAALALAKTGRSVALVAPAGREGRVSVANAPAGVVAGPATDAPVDPAADRASTASVWDLRVYALSPASRRLLADLGVWDRMPAERIAPVYDMRLFQERAPGVPDPRPVHLDAYRGRVEALAWIVEHRGLVAALESALADPGLAGRVSPIAATVAGLRLPAPDAARGLAVVSLADGRELTGALVVGADGTDSTLRELAGLQARVSDLGQTAVVANFDSGRPHGDCAWQWFGAAGIVALLPLPADDRPGAGRVSLVWSVDHEHAQRAVEAGAQALASRIEALSRGALGPLAPISGLAAFPLRSVRMAQTIRPGLVLVGDAAHAVHPMAGQGMNLGFGDVAALAGVLGPRIGAEGPPAPVPWLALRRYERMRREPVLAMQLALDGLGRAFGPLPGPVAALRNTGWGLVGRSSWLRRRLIAHAVS